VAVLPVLKWIVARRHPVSRIVRIETARTPVSVGMNRTLYRVMLRRGSWMVYRMLQEVIESRNPGNIETGLLT